MNEYKQMAIDFLNKVGAKIVIHYIGDVEGFPNSDDHMMHRKYEVILRRGDKKLEIPFYGSYADWKREEDPDEYDILACLEKYDVGSIDDFVADFGYEVHNWSDVKRIENIYKDVVAQYSMLNAMFSEEETEMLREIN